MSSYNTNDEFSVINNINQITDKDNLKDKLNKMADKYYYSNKNNNIYNDSD